jgi:hypothetical protein
MKTNKMKNKIKYFVLALLVIGIVSTGTALAYGKSFSQGCQGRNTNYANGNTLNKANCASNVEMQKIMSTGTYSDLTAYRQKTGYDMMPWVKNENDFNLAQQMHTKMLQWRQANGNTNSQGYGLGMKVCPIQKID